MRMECVVCINILCIKRWKHRAYTALINWKVIMKSTQLNSWLLASAVVVLGVFVSVTNMESSSEQNPDTKNIAASKETVQGKWISELNGDAMLDPQTSGLKHWRGKLLSISDASADSSQQKQLHLIDPNSAVLEPEVMQISLSDELQQGCFADYLSGEPDYEALAVNPNNDNEIIIVTEDATRGAGLSKECMQRFNNSGSTDYPTLLVRLVVKDNNMVEATHIRPLQFAPEFNVGDFPNDGIEGLAFGQNNQLYLGLEKDKNKNARIFSVQINEDFWNTEDFAKVSDPELLLPEHTSGNHPINGMDYLAVNGKSGYLIAAARNDSQLWIIDLAKKQPTKIIDLTFLAPTDVSNGSCDVWDKMDNASIEGLGIIGDTIWMVNDPWKRNYMKNVACPSNEAKFKTMSPLLFSMPVSKLSITSL